MPTSAPASRPPPVPPAAAPARSGVPPLVPVILPLVVTAVVLGVLFAQLSPGAGPARAVGAARFTNVTEESGLHFVHHSAAQEAPTTLGGAVVVLDYDRDGHPDLFFVNGTAWPWEDRGAWTRTAACGLFRNDGTGHFTDVTRAAGLDFVIQGMAATAGDFDGDGYPDLFITGVGSNRLLRNRGDGTFEDVTAAAGVGGDDNTWSTGATWIDYDGDGLLDLVVLHYARWPHEVGLAMAFTIADVGRSYGAPTGFLSVFPSVYRNLGHGRFALVPGSAGLRDIDRQTGLPVMKPLAVVPVDVNGDGRLDLLFTYHTAESALFVNQGDGTFRRWSAGRDIRHEGASAGLASASAVQLAPEARVDECFAALRRGGGGGGGAWTPLAAKLGVALFDYDLDGQPELFSGSGRAEPDTNKFEGGREFQAVPQLLAKVGEGWVPVAPAAGSEGGGWAKPLVVRGVAVADFDGDGDLDVVLAQNNGPAQLLRNDQRGGLPWLRLRLVATHSHPEAGGARVEVRTPRRTLVQTVAPVLGFMAQSESELTFGLGDDARVRAVVIYWPSGQRQEIRPVAINRTLVITEP